MAEADNQLDWLHWGRPYLKTVGSVFMLAGLFWATICGTGYFLRAKQDFDYQSSGFGGPGILWLFIGVVYLYNLVLPLAGNAALLIISHMVLRRYRKGEGYQHKVLVRCLVAMLLVPCIASGIAIVISPESTFGYWIREIMWESSRSPIVSYVLMVPLTVTAVAMSGAAKKQHISANT